MIIPEGAACAQQTGPRWYRGNLHTHTLWSDGDDYPEMIVSWYKQRGYHFLALSDHNILSQGKKWIVPTESRGGMDAFRAYKERFGAGWVDTKEAGGAMRVRLKTLEELRGRFEQPGRFLMIQSEEITDGYDDKPIHVNATNVAERIDPAHRGNSVLEVMQNNVDAVFRQRERLGRPMFPHINHPNFGWAITAQDLIRLERDRFFEVYNGHPAVHNEGDALRPSTERLWDIVLTKRRGQGRLLMYGLAVDDAHDYHTFDSTRSNPGRGWVMVRADTLSARAIIGAMEAGRFYATTGVDLERVTRMGNTLHVAVQPEPGVSYTVQFIGTRRGYERAGQPVPDTSLSPLRRTYSEDIGVVLKEGSGPSASYTMAGDELYVRAKVISSKPKENPYEEGEVEVAWIQPVVP